MDWKVYLVNCGFFLCYGKCNFWDFLFFLCTTMPSVWISMLVYSFAFLVILGKICVFFYRRMRNGKVEMRDM